MDERAARIGAAFFVVSSTKGAMPYTRNRPSGRVLGESSPRGRLVIPPEAGTHGRGSDDVPHLRRCHRSRTKTITSEFVTPAKSPSPRESPSPPRKRGRWTTIGRCNPSSHVLRIRGNDRRSAFQPSKVTPATMDATPHSSSMGPSLRRDDDARRSGLPRGHVHGRSA